MDAWLASAISGVLDRVRVPLFVAFLAVFGWVWTNSATAKPLWHDEIYTLLLSRLPSVSAIWAAHRDGVDLMPPLNTLLTRVTRRAAGGGPVATRIPPLLGFVLTMIVIFAMVRRRAGATLAFTGVLALIQTAAYRYSYEARGYGLMLGFFAAALYAWTESASDRRRKLWIPVLAASLAAGVWTHYYAAFAFLVVGLGEATRQANARRVDLPISCAILAAGLLALPLTPLIKVAADHASRFWARSASEGIWATYGSLLEPLPSELWSTWGGIVLVALFFSASTAWIARGSVDRSSRMQETTARSSRLPAHEVVALVATVAAPGVLLLLSRWTTGAFTERYGFIGVVGIAIGLPLVVRALAPRGSLAEALLLVFLAVPFTHTVVANVLQPRPQPPDPFRSRPVLAAALRRPGPVIASGSLTYLQLWYYAPANVRSRLIYLADPAHALQLTGTDTVDRGYLALARWTPVAVMTYDQFVSRNRDCVVYAAGSGWLLPLLEANGASVEMTASEIGGAAYHVVMTGLQ